MSVLDKKKCPFLKFSNNFFRNFRSFSDLEHLVGIFLKVVQNFCYHNLKKGTMANYFTPKYLKIKWTFIIYVEKC